MTTILKTTIFSIITLLPLSIFAKEHIVYDGAPFTILLQPGHERLVEFPEKVVLGIPAKNVNDFSTKTTVDNRLFIEAARPFKHSIKVIAKGVSGVNYIILFETTSIKQEQSVTIHKSEIETKPTGRKGENSSNIGNNQSETVQPLNYAELVRYALQKELAPKRLVKEDARVRKLTIKKTPKQNLFNCAHHNYSCRAIVSNPITSYQAQNGWYVSVLELKNVSDTKVHVDPRLARIPGALASTTQHGVLLPKQYKSASKTRFVVIHKHHLDKWWSYEK